MDQKLMWEASLLERQVQEIEQEKELVERELEELSTFSENLKVFDASKEKTLLSSLGKGVLLKTELVEKNLFVNVGAGIMVKKTPAEIQKVVEGQIERFTEIRMHLLSRMESLSQSLQNLLKDMQNGEHSHSEDCDCGDECAGRHDHSKCCHH